MVHLWFTINALFPLLLLAFLGYSLKRANVINQSFIDQLNRYIFLVALPVLVFITMARIENLSQVNWQVVYFTLVMFFSVFLIGYLALSFSSFSKETRPVLLQAFFRGNFVIIGIPLAIRLGGTNALTMIVILNAFLLPLTNILSIVTFLLWKKENRTLHDFFKEVFNSTIKNPLTMAFILGIMAYFLKLTLNVDVLSIDWFNETLGFIALTTTPMALIAIGGQFEINGTRTFRKPLLIGVFGRLVLVPLLVFSIGIFIQRWFDFSGSWGSLIALFASPVAVASVAITKGLNGDYKLASQMVIWSTFFAMLSLFIITFLFRTIGLL